MDEEMVRTANRTEAQTRSPRTKYTLALVLGTIVFFTQHSKAQAPAQVAAPVPSGSAFSTPPAESPPPSASDVYLINPSDSLDIDVYDVPELSHTYTVSPSGFVSMPLLPTPIKASGLTPDQFAKALEDAYRQSGRLLRPEIAISVKQSPTSSVAVEGAVKNPLILSEIGRVKLVEIITQCGGLADDAGTNLTITRGSLGMRDLAMEGGHAIPTITIELKKVMDVSDPASRIEVWPGDRVSIDRELPEVYYVLGEVKTPGGYTLKNRHDELTVLRAIALAGDVTGVAKKTKAMIIRKDPTAPQGREEIKLDLQSILAGKSPDPALQADDILFVPGSNEKKALHTLENAPAMIVGEAGAAALITH